jgi:hypothetical protein
MSKINIKNLIKESITDYLTELNIEKEEIQETPILEEGASEFEDKVTKDGNIYLIKTPTKDMSEGGIVEEVSLKSLIGEGYVGAYLAGPQALAAGKKALKARDTKLKENVEVGKSKVAELEAKIEGLKKTIEDNSTRAVHDPQRRGELTETNDGLFTQLEKIENAVEKLKAALEKESPKKAKKEEKEDLNEGDPNAVYYLVKSASTGKYLVMMASKNASMSTTGTSRFKSESEAQKEADKRNKKDVNEVTSNTSKAFKWFWGTDAKEIVKRVQALSDKELEILKDATQGATGGPQKVQKQFLDREFKKRGL